MRKLTAGASLLAISLLAGCGQNSGTDYAIQPVAKGGGAILARLIPTEYNGFGISADDADTHALRCYLRVAHPRYDGLAQRVAGWFLDEGVSVALTAGTDQSGLNLTAYRDDNTWVISGSNIDPGVTTAGVFEAQVKSCIEQLGVDQKKATVATTEVAKNTATWLSAATEDTGEPSESAMKKPR